VRQDHDSVAGLATTWLYKWKEPQVETVTYRVIRNKPGEFEQSLSDKGSLILTKKGKPLALLVDISDQSLAETLRLISQVRAQIAVSKMRREARQSGVDRLGPEEITAEVDAVRAVLQEPIRKRGQPRRD